MVHFIEAEGTFAPRSPQDSFGIDACSTSCNPHHLEERFNIVGSRRLFRLSRDVDRFSGTPLASVSAASAIGALRNLGLKQQFRFLAGGSQGILTEADLRSYVTSQGLPSTYVPQFLNYLRKTTAAASTVLLTHAAGRQLQRQADLAVPQTLPDQLPPLPTDLDAFRKFVGSRETALTKAFGMFDKDKHGSISSADLESALRHVTLCCPKSRCMYKRSKQCQEARRIILGATQGAERPIPYPEFRDLFLSLPASDVMVKYWLAAGCVPDLDTRVGTNTASGTLKGASPWGHLLAGAVAGATSRTATAPLETLRLSAMAGTLSDTNIVRAAQNIVNQEGWKGLYKGNLLNVMRAAPQKALDFFAFDMFKRVLGATPDADGNVPLVRTFLAAGLAGASSSVTLYPLEVLRSRITVAKSTGASVNVVAALLNIVRTEGPRALYKGLLPSVAAIFPEAAITYGLHDLLKSTYRSFHDGKEPGVVPGLSLGVASAFTGQLVAFPLEAVARRLQLARGGAGGLEGVRQVVTQIIQEGGPMALYRGVGTATVRLIPMAMTSFGTYELVRALLVHLEERQERQEAEHETTRTCGSSSLSATVTPLEVTPLLASELVAAPLGPPQDLQARSSR